MIRVRAWLLSFVVICVGFPAACFYSGNSSAIFADEPAEEFLEALLERGYFDIAISYLGSLENSDLISEEYRKVLPFEKAETLIKSAGRVRDMNVLEERLNEAESLLEKFSDSDAPAEVQAKTNRYRGNLRMGRARLYFRQAQSSRLTQQERADLIGKSRTMLAQALSDYTAAREALKTAIQNFQIDVSDAGTTKQLKRLRLTYTQIRLRLPIVKEQLADSFPGNSPDQNKLLAEAAKEYIYLYDTYRRFPAGLDSGLYAARCYYKLGNSADALLRLKELFALENNSTFKGIKRKALLLGADCWETIKPYPAIEVINECSPLVNVLTRQELRQPDWLRIQLALAKAYHVRAVELKAEKSPGSTAKIRDYNRQATKLVKTVSRSPGELKDQAKQLMAEWNLDVKSVSAEETTPVTFLEARQKGEDLVTELQSLADERAKLVAKLSGAAGTQKPALEAELGENESLRNDLSTRALQMFELALGLADEKTELAEINKLRYLQSYCYFVTGHFFESALIGQFVLDRYPTVDWSRQAASIAVRSYTSLYNNAPKDDRSGQKDRLTEVCRQVVQRWPGSSECSASASTLTAVSIESRDFDNAEAYFSAIGEDFSSRSSMALKLGQRMWFSYSKADDNVTAEEKQALLKKARSYLELGLNNTEPEQVNYDAALGSLLLVSAHLANGDVDKAVSRLENVAIAPLDLLKQKHPAVTESSKAEIFRRGTYNTAIDVYLAAMRNGGNQKEWVDKAGGIISAMKSSANPGDLTNTYRRIAASLKQQFDSFQSADEKTKFSRTLATFLGAIEKDSNDAETVLWAGSTLLSVGNSLIEQNLQIEAKPLFAQAVSALTRAEELGFSGAKSKSRMLELQRQKALANRGNGKYQEAIDQLVEVLKESPNNLDFQMDAAETLHLLAEQKKSPNAYAEAASGKVKVKDKRTRKETNVIWGWRKLFQVTANKKKYREQNLTALHNQIDAMYHFGKLKPNPRAVQAAKKQLEKFAAADPTMGGPKWKIRFEELRKKMN